jgi:glycerol-3-phosphate dehydrogenase
MNRLEAYAEFHRHTGPWDIVIVGGGATGMGIAVDAASRGYSTLLLEQSDFGKGTSSRSTKLIHGGVRYLEQGNVPLVLEALRERGLLARNAPHLVHPLAFVVPAYRWWETPFYGAGLKLYGLLAGKRSFGRSRVLSRRETLARLPGVREAGLRGGILYFDSQFDDARLLIHLALTAAGQGATLLNYAQVTEASKTGVRFRDLETGEEFGASARMIINAAGPFSDAVRRLADPSAAPIIAPSQGVHLVFDRSFLPGDTALMVPHTSDGRVMFAIPWHGRTLIGTTETPVSEPLLEPTAFEREIAFLLETSARYLARKPERADIRSIFAGIRPLVGARTSAARSAISRDHSIRLEPSGLLTIAGGKWTTYRLMAEDCVNRAAAIASLPPRPCVTRDLAIHGWPAAAADAEGPLDPALPYTAADIARAARDELARTVDDALARRTRALFLDAHAAVRMAPAAARILARELGRDPAWEAAQVRDLETLARNYLPADPGGTMADLR